jgi:hypothetical protein
MMSPYCFVCHRPFCGHDQGGRLVAFADYVESEICGMPPGLGWFCDKHVEAAESLASMPIDEALKELEARLGVFEEPDPPIPMPTPALWVRSPGPNVGKVVMIVRQARSIAPAEVLDKLRTGAIEVTRSPWGMDFEYYKAALIEAGATVEVRYGPNED